MTRPVLSKRLLIISGITLAVIVVFGIGLVLLLHRANSSEVRNQNEFKTRPTVKIVVLPGNREQLSDSASSRLEAKSGRVDFDWGDRDFINSVKSMEIAQNGFAEGDIGASEKLKSRMMAISTYLQSAKLEDMTQSEIDYVIAYTLSGGRPIFAKRILVSKKLSKLQTSLLNGVVEFEQGEKKKADELLSPIDAMQFKPLVAAHLLMVQAELGDTASYETRRAKLAQAADMALGTLLEESAIRRSVVLAAQAGVASDFHYWSDRYLRRFSNSLYRGDFLNSYINALSTFESKKLPLALSRVDDVYARLPLDIKIHFLSELQSNALRQGLPRLCNYAGRKSRELSVENSAAPDRLILYSIACGIGERNAEVQSQLSQVNDGDLSENDRQLRTAVGLLQRGIEYQAVKPVDAVYGPSLPYPQFDSVKALTARVTQQIESTDRTIKGIMK